MRQSVINIIKAEATLNGAVTKKAMRLYVENRISKKTFDKVISEGIRIYLERK